MSACRVPCATCPWRRDRHADTIPTYKHELAEALVTSTGREFGAPIFACHQSRPEQEVICIGWLWRYGWHNIAIRLMLSQHRITPEQVDMPPEWDDRLHKTFEEMIEKLRADVARMEDQDGRSEARERDQ